MFPNEAAQKSRLFFLMAAASGARSATLCAAVSLPVAGMNFFPAVPMPAAS